MESPRLQRDYGITVATRIRPFNNKELAESVGDPTPIAEIDSHGSRVTLLDPTQGFTERSSFSYDHVFSAFRPSIELNGSSQDVDESSNKAQEEIYESLGAPVVNAAWEGYNTCIFAYGQTSSGKTYTMMGTKRDPGIIPRLCRNLFEKIETDELGEQSDSRRKLVKCTVSYMEIYNEQARDLLKIRPKGQRMKFASRFDNKDADADEYQQLKVRHHPLHGPFVDGITKLDVDNWLECVKVIRAGNEVRSSAATEMNDQSSRSHAIFQIVLTQTEALGARVRGKEVTNHRVSKINLVDLAGSERTTRTNVTGKHLAEANSINQSLSTLRKVFEALISKVKKPSQTLVIPYRESLLTWILSDNFGGNSKTVMIANVSPHESNFLETEGTLRYATLAKGIVNRVRVNEDPSTKLIKELQAQLKALQDEMVRHQSLGDSSVSFADDVRLQELENQMEENRRAMEELHAREEGMRQLIQESRLREEKLLIERETLVSSEEKWRKEAQRLMREKETLQATLSTIAKDNPQLLLANSRESATFWSPNATASLETDDISVRDPNATDKEVAAEACPPRPPVSNVRAHKPLLPDSNHSATPSQKTDLPKYRESAPVHPVTPQIAQASPPGVFDSETTTPKFGRRAGATPISAGTSPVPEAPVTPVTSASGARAGRRAVAVGDGVHVGNESRDDTGMRVPPWRRNQ